MLLNIAICDDEISEIKKIEDYLITFSVQSGVEFNIDKYSDGNELLNAYNGNTSKYDAVFLDVEMPKISGMKLGQHRTIAKIRKM